jgi:hypothetical protein
MNFQPLFTTSRVVVAVYRTLSTTVLLYYLMKRMKNGRAPRDHHHGRFGTE